MMETCREKDCGNRQFAAKLCEEHYEKEIVKNKKRMVGWVIKE